MLNDMSAGWDVTGSVEMGVTFLEISRLESWNEGDRMLERVQPSEPEGIGSIREYGGRDCEVMSLPGIVDNGVWQAVVVGLSAVHFRGRIVEPCAENIIL